MAILLNIRHTSKCFYRRRYSFDTPFLQQTITRMHPRDRKRYSAPSLLRQVKDGKSYHFYEKCGDPPPPWLCRIFSLYGITQPEEFGWNKMQNRFGRDFLENLWSNNQWIGRGAAHAIALTKKMRGFPEFKTQLLFGNQNIQSIDRFGTINKFNSSLVLVGKNEHGVYKKQKQWTVSNKLYLEPPVPYLEYIKS
jgi:hypothetical protein